MCQTFLEGGFWERRTRFTPQSSNPQEHQPSRDRQEYPTYRKETNYRRRMDGLVVTIYPSLPQSSFLGSGEQTLVAQQHGEDLESQDLRFACNTSCTPTIHMSTPTQKPLLDTGASHCLLPYSTLSKQNAEKARKIHLRVASGKPVRLSRTKVSSTPTAWKGVCSV